jgi:acyl-CoA synthetase (AMP-forming)/AMP-acid ligase II
MMQFNSKIFVKLLKKNNVVGVVGIPLMFQKLMRQKGFDGPHLKNMRIMFCGGDDVSEAFIQEFNTYFEKWGSDARLRQGYGLTEIASVCCTNTNTDNLDGSIGKALRGVNIEIWDDDKKPVPNGTIGEIVISGPTLMSGYYTDGAEADGADGADEGLVLDEADEAFEKGEAFDAGLRLFTLRGLIAFFSVMGWVGTICCGEGINLTLSILISVASGFLAMFVIAALMKWLFSLQYDGTEDIRDALGVSGTVYMRIPPSRTGKGKITAVIQGKLCEKYAVTDEETILNRDEEVTVVGISGEETLIVRRKHRK